MQYKLNLLPYKSLCQATDQLNGQEVLGQQVKVNVARPKNDGGGGGGRGGYGGGRGGGGYGGGGGGYGGGGYGGDACSAFNLDRLTFKQH